MVTNTSSLELDCPEVFNAYFKCFYLKNKERFMNKYLFLLLLSHSLVMADVNEFIEPRFEGLRVDRCLSWGIDCDEPAAYNWCLEKGFAKAVYWELDHNVGTREPTKMLSSKQICNKPGCDAFKTIVCYKSSSQEQ